MSRPFAELLEERLFTPLQMDRSSVGLEALQVDENWARPHVRRRRGSAWQPVRVKENYYRISAAGGLNASLNDMVRWLKAQMGQEPEVLPASVLSKLHLPLVAFIARALSFIRGGVSVWIMLIMAWAGGCLITKATSWYFIVVGCKGIVRRLPFCRNNKSALLRYGIQVRIVVGICCPFYFDRAFGLKNLSAGLRLASP